jgi:hypothetical protein
MFRDNDTMTNNESSLVVKVIVKVKRIFERKNGANARDLIITTRMGRVNIEELIFSAIGIVF